MLRGLECSTSKAPHDPQRMWLRLQTKTSNIYANNTKDCFSKSLESKHPEST